LARVTEITQEWRIQQQQNRPQGIEAKCACSVTPNYNREFGKAQFWTMAIPIERKVCEEEILNMWIVEGYEI